MSTGGKGAVARGNSYNTTNPMTNAASGMQDMFRMLQQASGGIQTPAGTYAPQTGQAQGYTAQRYRPDQMQAQDYQAQMQQGPEQIRSLMQGYMNPYENQVVQRATANMQRQNQMMQMQNAADASAAGAFGGSRHGIVEALTNAETNRNVGDMTAQLRQQGWDTAAGLAGQDIANRMAVRDMNQQATNEQRQYNAGNRQQGQLANQAAINDARQYGATAGNAAQQFNAGNRQQMQLANMGAINDARSYNAAANERNNGAMFDRAMQVAQGFGSAAGQSFGMGNTINQNQMQQGAMQQALLQQVLNSSQGLYNQYTQHPQQVLQQLLSAAGMSPLSGAQTQTQTAQQPNTLLPNLLQAAGNMFQFAPIPFPGKGGAA